MDGDGCDEMVQGGYWVNPLQNRWMDARVAHGDRFRISDIDLPKGATTLIADRDFMIATIKNSAAGQSDAGDTTAEGEAEA